MKKSIFFLIIVLIVIALSFTIVINSVNGKNKSDLNLAKEQPMKIKNDQVNVIEEPENKVIEDNTEVEDVQTNTEITEVIDQPQIQEMQEEKVISSTPKIEKKTQVVQTTKVESKPQEKALKRVQSAHHYSLAGQRVQSLYGHHYQYFVL